jgi:shufflon-specific DNA recombinase
LVRVQSCLPDFIYLSPVPTGLFIFLRTSATLLPSSKSGSFPVFAEKYAVNLRQRVAIKLPKPRKRGDAWRIEILFEGQRYSATRDTARECERWAAERLLSLKAGQKVEHKSSITFRELFRKSSSYPLQLMVWCSLKPKKHLMLVFPRLANSAKCFGR